MLSTMDAPSMSETIFTNLEDKICTWWQSVFEEKMLKTWREDRKIAIEKVHFHEGIPTITVISDGRNEAINIHTMYMEV